MAQLIKMIIPDFHFAGRALYLDLFSLSLGTNKALSATAGASGEKAKGPGDAMCTCQASEKTSLLHEAAMNSGVFPLIKIEYSEATKTTLKAAMLFEFKNAILSHFSYSNNGGAPMVQFGFGYDSLKPTYFK